jgi:hypothetical protein
LQQQTPRIVENVTLFPFISLSASKPGGSMQAPLFSALLTLWLSTMQAVGLASRPILSRHLA